MIDGWSSLRWNVHWLNQLTCQIELHLPTCWKSKDWLVSIIPGTWNRRAANGLQQPFGRAQLRCRDIRGSKSLGGCHQLPNLGETCLKKTHTQLSTKRPNSPTPYYPLPFHHILFYVHVAFPFGSTLKGFQSQCISVMGSQPGWGSCWFHTNVFVRWN